jgi:hypothetical protein
MSATPPSAQNILFSLLLQFGSTIGQERILASIRETISKNQGQVFNKTIAGNATNVAVDLSAYVGTLNYLVITDRGGKGFKISMSNTGTKIPVVAGGYFFYKHDDANVPTPPIFYIDATSATDATDLEIAIGGNTTS